jgi:hypothetical protein
MLKLDHNIGFFKLKTPFKKISKIITLTPGSCRPDFGFVVVQKKINTKFFLGQQQLSVWTNQEPML